MDDAAREVAARMAAAAADWLEALDPAQRGCDPGLYYLRVFGAPGARGRGGGGSAGITSR